MGIEEKGEGTLRRKRGEEKNIIRRLRQEVDGLGSLKNWPSGEAAERVGGCLREKSEGTNASIRDSEAVNKCLARHGEGEEVLLFSLLFLTE